MEIRINGDIFVRIDPDFDTFLCKFLTFLNTCISVKTGPINTKLGDFVNLGVLFLTMWINMNVVPRSTMNTNGETEN